MVWIDEIIDEIITGVKDIHCTDNIYELYNALEIIIRYLDKDNILLQGNDALYNRCYLDQEVVFIRNDLDHGYEKFILAHELGHALLHTSLKTSPFNPLMNINKLEKQANYFAVKILNVDLDSIALEGFTIDQIASTLELPVAYVTTVREIETEYMMGFEGRCNGA